MFMCNWICFFSLIKQKFIVPVKLVQVEIRLQKLITVASVCLKQEMFTVLRKFSEKK